MLHTSVNFSFCWLHFILDNVFQEPSLFIWIVSFHCSSTVSVRYIIVQIWLVAPHYLLLIVTAMARWVARCSSCRANHSQALVSDNIFRLCLSYVKKIVNKLAFATKQFFLSVFMLFASWEEGHLACKSTVYCSQLQRFSIIWRSKLVE